MNTELPQDVRDRIMDLELAKHVADETIASLRASVDMLTSANAGLHTTILTMRRDRIGLESFQPFQSASETPINAPFEFTETPGTYVPATKLLDVQMDELASKWERDTRKLYQARSSLPSEVDDSNPK